MHASFKSALCIPSGAALLLFALALPGAAQQTDLDYPVQIPPTLFSVRPAGVQRGQTTTLTVAGANLDAVQAVLFDTPGFTATVTGTRRLPDPPKASAGTGAAVPQGRRHEVTLDVTADAGVPLGLHRFRLETPEGTSNVLTFDLGLMPATAVRPEAVNLVTGEGLPGQSRETSNVTAQEVNFPAIIVGTLQQPGVVHRFRFDGLAGQALVFKVVAAPLGSALRSVLHLEDVAGKVIAGAGDVSPEADAVLTARLPADGTYTIALSDLEMRGGENFYYRLEAGELPHLARVFPLGLRAGTSAELALLGENLDGGTTLHVTAPAQVAAGATGLATIAVGESTPEGDSINQLRVAVGPYPEVMEREPNNDPQHAQAITLPVTINGRIAGGTAATPDEDYFRFTARAGERLVFDVAASRLGSPLDSVIEVLDTAARPIPIADVRAVDATAISFRPMNGSESGVRLVSTKGLRVGDHLVLGDELLQIDQIPDFPDADIRMRNYQGGRLDELGGSPSVHPVDAVVYKAEILPPGKHMPPNGLPVFHFTARNDDGGPGYGEDSHLVFTAPADGAYYLHLKDTRGFQGDDFAYRLTVRDETPDFTLTANPSNPNIPAGGRVAVQVIADRRLGYQGDITLQASGLPAGVSADATHIAAGQQGGVILLSAAPDAKLTPSALPFTITGTADVDGRPIRREADPEQPLRVAAVVPSPDLTVQGDTQVVTLEPGKQTTFTFHVERKNGFAGRVPCSVMNLPYGVDVANFGLNGVLVPPNETSRTVTLTAEPGLPSQEIPIYVVGAVESASSTRHASPAIILRIGKPEVATAQK